jgi:hypothetical protein
MKSVKWMVYFSIETLQKTESETETKPQTFCKPRSPISKRPAPTKLRSTDIP